MRSISFSEWCISSIDSSRSLAGEVLVAPVVLHLGVDEVLVDRRELGGQDVVEQLNDLGVALHGVPPGGRVGGDREVVSGRRLPSQPCAGEQRLDRRQTATAPRANSAPLGQRLRIERSGGDLLGDAPVVHHVAVADEHDGLVLPRVVPCLSESVQHA